MAMRGGDSDEPIVDINITPFVDIILVVLIIFMVTTPMIMNPSINIQLPKAVTGEETKSTPLTFSILKDGEVMLNGKKIADTDIVSLVGNEIKTNPDAQAIISADKDVTHGTVIKIIDLIKQGGVHKFAISTEK
jgi:biopolymer transport protein ExbD